MIYPLLFKTQAETFVPQARDHSMPVLKAGQAVAFAWGFTAAQYRASSRGRGSQTTRGPPWQIDTNLHLRKLSKRYW